MFWFTGLAGSGKTTLALAFLQQLQALGRQAIFLDGDRLRRTIAEDLGYSREERLGAALRYARLCALLASQGFWVVCATISMFDQVRNWHRENTPGYQEIYVRVLPEVLAARDQKGLYSGAAEGREKNVAGIDLEVELPTTPDVVVDNNGDATPEVLAETIARQILPWLEKVEFFADVSQAVHPGS